MPTKTAHPYTITYTIEDSKGQTSRVALCAERRKFGFAESFAQPNPSTGEAENEADVEYLAIQFGYLLQSIISGKITNISVSTQVLVSDFPGTGLTAFRANALANSDTEEGCRFTFKTEGGYITKHRVPTILESKMDGDTGYVNYPDDPDVELYVDVIIRAPGLSGNYGPLFTDERNDYINTYLHSAEYFHASRKSKR